MARNQPDLSDPRGRAAHPNLRRIPRPRLSKVNGLMASLWPSSSGCAQYPNMSSRTKDMRLGPEYHIKSAFLTTKASVFGLHNYVYLSTQSSILYLHNRVYQHYKTLTGPRHGLLGI